MTHTLFCLLAPLKFLRATPLDLFGKTNERKKERELITTYKAMIKELMDAKNPGKLELALQIANVPESIKGFGHVKERSIELAEERWGKLIEEFKA